MWKFSILKPNRMKWGSKEFRYFLIQRGRQVGWCEWRHGSKCIHTCWLYFVGLILPLLIIDICVAVDFLVRLWYICFAEYFLLMPSSRKLDIHKTLELLSRGHSVLRWHCWSELNHYISSGIFSRVFIIRVRRLVIKWTYESDSSLRRNQRKWS